VLQGVIVTTLDGRTALITGGTGSFGGAASRRLLDAGVQEVRILSRDEYKQDAMRRSFDEPRLSFYLGDVRDRTSIDSAMRGVDLVFHAAALKQVPSCEFFPMQAILTNVMGSHNVIESAIAHGVDRVVCLSTDKAAYPINTMGLTKALMEKVAQSVARLGNGSRTTVASVRYGNVLASRGSVVPLFLDQIVHGGPVTITVPEMTRFLLPLSEAIDLVLFALEHARPGDLFVRKAPACTVADLSLALQQLLGTHVDETIIGIRHGEKMYETLATREELGRAEDLDSHYRIAIDDRDLNYGKYFTEGNPGKAFLEDYTSQNARRLTVQGAAEVLRTLPEVREFMAAGQP
jgi:UDP-N-acetylglucosamine 4,6-dehydratase/5-epimerase